MSETIEAYKLFRVRKNKTLGPLFIDMRLVYEENVWMQAKSVPTKGFAFRPGFHATHAPHAPHLKTEGREWRKVLLRDVTPYKRPDAQGGLWYTAMEMMVLPKGCGKLSAGVGPRDRYRGLECNNHGEHELIIKFPHAHDFRDDNGNVYHTYFWGVREEYEPERD